MMLSLLLAAVLILQQIHGSSAQQPYVNNKQLDCNTYYTNTLGYVCNGAPSCQSYLTFRSTTTYDSPLTIGFLLGADHSQIAQINHVSDVYKFSPDTLVIVPVNCSCFQTSNNTKYYQHNSYCNLGSSSDTYFVLANNTFQGLTTCQSLIAQNPYTFRQLVKGMNITVPLRCACPTSNQTAEGIKYLLSYLVTWGDSLESIGSTFGGVSAKSILEANELSSDNLIFPFTPLLVPLHSEPTKINITAKSTFLPRHLGPPRSTSPRPPSSPQLPTVPVGDGNSSSHKWVKVGAGVGGAVLLLAFSGLVIWLVYRRRRSKPAPGKPHHDTITKIPESNDFTATRSKSWSVSSEGVRYAIGGLTAYKFEELQKATGFFGEANRIKGSVYKGFCKGDQAAVKVMKGDVSEEINILKQIKHSNIIRLSGFCVHDGNTYLVYELAEKGSLSDWLHPNPKTDNAVFSLGWKKRVQIAYDVADALNYLHNYTSPPYVHKNLKSSNIILDGEFRAKVANFGLARTLTENQDLQLTRHVVGARGYMAPEYVENDVVTPKLDVYAFGVVILELLSGREAACSGRKRNGQAEEDELLTETVSEVLGGDNVREKLGGFMDPSLGKEYPLDLAYSLAELARSCVAHDLNSRPTMAEVFMTLSKILTSSMDWDPSDELEISRSLSHGRCAKKLSVSE
ncbi:Non-specific serine/threonine protein kinase [Bertholletia excelsa]